VYSECLIKKALEGFGDFKIGGQIIHTVKYGDDFILLTEKIKVLQDMIDNIIEIGRCYKMEINMERIKSNENLKTTILSKNYDRRKTTGKLKSFKYLGNILTNNKKFTFEMKCRIAMAKTAFNKKMALFSSTLDLELRKKIVKCYIWSIDLYGAET
jgi:hypothetical protein